jgi:S-DNA-T family DNA segregation ATPase FtsK/SpoIIIE
LAKRRRGKKTSLGASLKFEVYGILLITFSVIAISGEAAVGRSLSKLFGFLLGKYYFMIALIGVWAGLYVMIKRMWPRGWTSRRTGFVLLGCGLALWSAMSAISGSLGPIDSVTPSSIISQTWEQLKEELWLVQPGQDVPMSEKNIGGGLVGAVQYSLLYWLFGYYGARFVLLIELAIALLLITNKSYVEMAGAVRNFLRRVAPLLLSRMSGGRRRPAVKAMPVAGRKAASAKLRPIPEPDEPEEAAGGEARRKTPYFFRLFHGKPDRGPDGIDPDDPWDSDEPVLYGFGKDAGPRHTGEPPAEEAASPPPDSGEAAEAPGGARPPEEPAFRSWNEPPDDDGGVPFDPDPVRGAGPGAADATADSPAAESAGGEEAEEAGTPAPPRAPAAKPRKSYRTPPLNLLNRPQGGSRTGGSDYKETARKLEATLESFGVRAKVLDVARGPAVTRYELQPDVGVKVSRIVSLTDDIALALAAKDIRMEAPIPGKSAIGIEVPNAEVSIVTLREVLETPAFQEAPGKLTIAFGRDISGQPIVGNLARMPHLLVAGATGSGKSVCINGIITSLLYKAKPDEVKFLMIDPKMVELNVYNGIPHLLAPVVTDPRRASLALKKIVVEMEKRYELFSKTSTRNIEGYNQLMRAADNPDGVLPYIVVIVDELADLMMVAAGDVEDSICRLAQMARAAGIHLIIATQRPSVDVITGLIKANIPSRIAFGVSSQVDSRTILDMAGAEKLLGRGDMLFLPMGSSKPIRVQGAFLSDAEVEAVVGYVRGQAEAVYDEDLVPEVDDAAEEADETLDELYDQAVQIVLEAKQASVSLLQRRMRIGYTRAARLIDSMEARGIVGPYEGSKPREVLMSLEQYQQNQNRIPS